MKKNKILKVLSASLILGSGALLTSCHFGINKDDISNITDTASEMFNVTIVALDSDGNTVSTYTQKVKEGTNYSPVKPTIKGYDFVGWYTDTNFVFSVEDSIAINGDTTLYAKVIKNNDPIEDVTNPDVSDKKDDIDVPNVPKEDTPDAPKEDVPDIPKEDTPSTTETPENPDSSSDVDEAKTSTVTYVMTTNEKTTKRVETVKNNTVFDLYVPNIDDYEFKGWYLDDSFTNMFSASTITGDITLYAKLDKIQTEKEYISEEYEQEIIRAYVNKNPYLYSDITNNLTGNCFAFYSNLVDGNYGKIIASKGYINKNDMKEDLDNGKTITGLVVTIEANKAVGARYGKITLADLEQNSYFNTNNVSNINVVQQYTLKNTDLGNGGNDTKNNNFSYTTYGTLSLRLTLPYTDGIYSGVATFNYNPRVNQTIDYENKTQTYNQNGNASNVQVVLSSGQKTKICYLSLTEYMSVSDTFTRTVDYTITSGNDTIRFTTNDYTSSVTSNITKEKTNNWFNGKYCYTDTMNANYIENTSSIRYNNKSLSSFTSSKMGSFDFSLSDDAKNCIFEIRIS